ncbi:hypothetical protein GGX14DRAFT_439151 [Mycena pura]|uniref:SEC7 domain-containing protein n=1 Tax=Mycena pura TaxID=153505 RepID=A0AAD6YK21_9AGAR|nr:hypothetical protein GGX14DRAFT_439151 [Mycena pura]
MEPESSMSEQREQRMLAVAKLKRAASLPRMKDGRRPPMRPEALSEGEKANTDDERKGEIDTPSPEPIAQYVTPAAPDATGEGEDATVTPDAAIRPKRRSRSRTRSRGSKDLKLKARVAMSPTPSPLVPSDSSQDEGASSMATSLASPVPSNLAALQLSRLLRSPTPTTPGTRPPTPNNLPSLEDLQRGLFRSNSVGSASASRIMAMHKLTGGQEAYDPSPPPATPPLPGKLGRNNTVSGGERTAVRNAMLSRLGGRIAKEPEAEPPSGEESAPLAPSPTPKRRRRRSRRGSAGANTGVSDSEFHSTTPNTPNVPPTPLPLEVFPDPPPPATSPSRAASPRSPSADREEEPAPFPQVPPALSTRASPAEQERPEPMRRRSVVVEDEDEERVPLQPRQRGPSVTPPHLNYDYGIPAPPILSNFFKESARTPPPVLTAHSSRHPTPEYPTRNSPFTVPLQEKQSREEEEEEEFLYPADSYHSRNTYEERQISWVASPVPEIRMPIDDDEADEDIVDDEEDEEYDARPPSPRSSVDSSPHEAFDDTSPRNSFDSKGVIIEPETSPEIVPSQIPPSPSSVAALSQSASMVRTASDDSTSPQTYPARLSVASRTQDRSPLTTEFEWEDGKRNWDGSSTSTWDKIKTTFRSGSASGRRSRTNSIATRDRRDHTDSSVSRESGASLTGVNKGEMVSTPVNQPVMMQSASASASVVSLSPAGSAFPAASSADLLKYQNAKLFPFPGMKKLEEQRNRAKGMLTPSASTPDIATLFNGYETDPTQASISSYNNTLSQTPDIGRDRKLSHQASDTRLLDKYATMPASPPNFTTPSSPANIDYFNISTVSPTQSTGPKLPMTLPGVKQWLSSRKKSSQTTSSASTPIFEFGKPSPSASKKPSLSDLILRKDSALGKDWEDVDIVPLTPNENMFGKTSGVPETQEPISSPKSDVPPPASAPPSQSTFQDLETPPDWKNMLSSPFVAEETHLYSDFPPAMPSPPDLLSPTPDPSSSLSDYPAPSTSESSSTTSSRYSIRRNSGPQGSFVLERLEENLARGPRSPMWASAIDEPPRKLILLSEVLQVVNANTVKDRFLFLFSDILVIAKPVMQEQDNIIESYNLNPMERKYPNRKYLVKNVVLLSQLRFNADRADLQPKTSNYSTAPRNPMIRTFVHQFSKDPDHAITTLLSKSGTPDDPSMLGQLLFKILDLDRAQLGDYLSRRTSKVVLKAYVDSFRFVGVRVDQALRAFLLSIHVPSKSAYNATALDYLLDAFAGRWYEANARIVAYDKDLAIRLVRALVQLNEFLHGGIAQERRPAGYPKRSITGRDFVNAFRRYDSRYLVPDELLENVFDSVRKERLSQARSSSNGGPPDILIMNKRPLPARLTYKVQSDPIILRIPQADPDLTVQLFGQDLEFDPPVLTFARSAEASFRVIGQSLGSKTMIMCRSGPNALRYSGLPLSNSLVVERAFMRNTFEMAFQNHNGLKRRYMFSVDDPLIRHQWVVALRRQIDSASSIASSSLSQTSPGTSKFHRAAEVVAFKALQQTLMGTDSTSGAPPTAIRSALQRLNSNGSPRPLNGGSFRFPDPENSKKSNLHVRSKSRSKVYHRQGAGRNELDLIEPDDHLDFDLSSHDEGPLWSGQELEMQCRQNSSIPLVLAFLQVGSPEHGRF